MQRLLRINSAVWRLLAIRVVGKNVTKGNILLLVSGGLDLEISQFSRLRFFQFITRFKLSKVEVFRMSSMVHNNSLLRIEDMQAEGLLISLF